MPNNSSDFNIKDWFLDHDFDLENPICDGKIHRTSRYGAKKKSAFYAIHTDPVTIIIAGDWKTDERWVFKDDASLSPNQKRTVRRKVDAARYAAKTLRIDEQVAVREKATALYDTVKHLTSHPYLDHKNITPCGAFTNGTDIMLPCRDHRGAVWGWQTITRSAKLFMKGQKVAGTSFTIDGTDEKIYITEGYATGASLHMATGAKIIVTFTASNLPTIAKITAPLHSRSKIIIAADNDHKLENNVGIKYATEASEAIRCELIIPEGIEGTDFNDYHCEKGLTELTKKLNDSNKVSPINRASHKAADRDNKRTPKAIIFKEIAEAMSHKSQSLPSFTERFVCVPAGGEGIKCYQVDKNNLARLSHPKIMTRAVIRYTNEVLNNMADYALLPEEAAKVVKVFEGIAIDDDVKIHNIAWPHEKDKIALVRMDFDLDPFVAGPPPQYAEFLSRCSNPDGFSAFIGSIFIDDSHRQQYLWVNGDGADGKGELYGFLLRLMKHATHTEQSPLQINRFWSSAFAGVRLLGFPDFSNPGWVTSGGFKQLCSDDPIRMEQKGGMTWSERVDAKIMFLSNKDLAITAEKSMLRRAVYTHVSSFEGKMIPNIRDKFWAERVALISYCLQKYAELTENHGPIIGQERHLEDAVDLGEMNHQIVFEKYFAPEDGAGVSRKDVRKALEWDGIKTQNDVSAFYGYLRRTGYTETKYSGDRRFKGMKLLRSPWN